MRTLRVLLALSTLQLLTFTAPFSHMVRATLHFALNKDADDEIVQYQMDYWDRFLEYMVIIV